MFWNDDIDGVEVKPVAPPVLFPNPLFFQDGDPLMGRPATVVTAAFLNTLQSELLHLLSAAGIAPDKHDDTQLLQAVKAVLNANFVNGIPPWSDAADYSLPAIVWGSDHQLYTALQPSGPTVPDEDNGGEVGPKDPVDQANNSAYWALFGQVSDETSIDESANAMDIYVPGYPGEVRSFLLSAPPRPWAAANGALISDADLLHPRLWRALQTSTLSNLVVNETEWQNRSTAASGVGGVPLFVQNLANRTIRLPDTRGDYVRNAFGGTVGSVGAWHGDAIRNLTGTHEAVQHTMTTGANGVLYYGPQISSGNYSAAAGSTANWNAAYRIGIDASRQVPTAAENRTRAYGVLGCVYLG